MNWEEIKKLHHLLGNGDNFKQTKEGGWVENTCTISGDARISGNARIYGNAHISGNACIYGDARISGDAHISGDARIYGNATVFGGKWYNSPLYIQGSKHAVTNSGINWISIGCYTKEISWWEENYKIIGPQEGYSDKQIKEYYEYILLIKKIGATNAT